MPPSYVGSAVAAVFEASTPTMEPAMPRERPSRVHIQLGRMRVVRAVLIESFMIRMASQDPEDRRAEKSLRRNITVKEWKRHDIAKEHRMTKDSPPALRFPYPFYEWTQ